MFCRYVLRTTNSSAARAFYADALGLVLPNGMTEGSVLEAWPLHERALEQGAPAHWLGQLAVSDVDAAVKQLVGLGGQVLGPTVQAQDGAMFATLRDPFGSVIGVCARKPSANESPVVWHQLHTRDADGAWSVYSELFGWAAKQTFEFPNLEGGYRTFAWNEAGAPVGALGNTARWPGVHMHWLFFLPVADVDKAAASVKAHGGTAMEPVVLPSGMRIAACEDPQGAAFGLAQRA
jgi:predicted enzyme related to lactoylglutathione lyase